MILTSCHWRRLDYSRQHAASLSACRGIERYTILAYVEPSPFARRIQDALDAIPARRVYVVINSHVEGCGKNTRKAIADGFGVGQALGHDFVVHVEDDVLLAPDALEYFAWARDQYRDDKSILNVTAWNRHTSEHHADMANEVRRKQWFSPWGWGTWVDRWAEINTKWVNEPWDRTVNEFIRGDRWQVYPTLGRSQNIGAEGGVYCPGPEWHREHQHCTRWAGLWDFVQPPGEWREAKAESYAAWTAK